MSFRIGRDPARRRQAATPLGLSYGRAGLRADGLGRFFARIKADGAPGPDHLPTAERRERAKQPTDGDPAFTDAEWQAIRTMCKA